MLLAVAAEGREMMIKESVVCDWCGATAAAVSVVGWLRVERFGVDVRVHDTDWREKHFCQWDCLYLYAKNQ